VNKSIWRLFKAGIVMGFIAGFLAAHFLFRFGVLE